MRGQHSPGPGDFKRWEALVVEGRDVSIAAKELGFKGSLAFKRADKDRHAYVLGLSREIREGIANDRGEKWALAENASPQERIAYLKAESSRYRQADKVEIGGNLSVDAGIPEGVDKFLAAVAAAGIRGSAGADAGGVPERVVERGEGRPRLAVAGLDGEAEPGSA